MPAIDPFFDTNIVLYALSTDAGRKEWVAERMSQGGLLSTQVLAESANVMRRKFGRNVAEIEAFHDGLVRACRIQIIQPSTIRGALKIVGRYGFSFYDSLIMATALEAGCSILYSEDMQHGQMIEGLLRVVNPFLGT